MDLAALSVMMGQPMGGGSPAGGAGGAPASPPPPTGGGGGGPSMDAAFPDQGYGDVLGPEAIKAARQAALFRAGLSLMAAGGPRPKGTRNMGADLLNAFDPNYYNSEIDRQVQARQTGMQFAAQRGIQQVSQKYRQTDPNESPVGRANRIASMASELAQYGPMGIQAAGQLSSIAKNLHDSIPSTELVEGVDDQQGSPTAGQRGHWLVNKEDGSHIQFYPLGSVLTPSEQASHAQEVLSGFEREKAPLLQARRSLDAFNTIYDQVKSRSAIDPQQGANLIALANDVIRPGTRVDSQQLMSGQTGPLPGELGHLIEAFIDSKHMTPEQVQSLKAMVDGVVSHRMDESKYNFNHWRGTWSSQVGNYPGIEQIDDPWADYQSGSPKPAPAGGSAGGAGGGINYQQAFPWMKH